MMCALEDLHPKCALREDEIDAIHVPPTQYLSTCLSIYHCTTYLSIVLYVYLRPWIPKQRVPCALEQMHYLAILSSFLLSRLELSHTQSLWAFNTSPPRNRLSQVDACCGGPIPYQQDPDLVSVAPRLIIPEPLHPTQGLTCALELTHFGLQLIGHILQPCNICRSTCFFISHLGSWNRG